MEKSRSCHRGASHAGVVFILAVLLLAGLGAEPALAARLSDVPTTTTWVTNGTVHVIECTSNTIYLGGTFTQVGPDTGNYVAISRATGQVSGFFPRIIGEVDSCISDEAGGWYIGGAFTQVGALARQYLAHILADGRVDPAWNPSPDGAVAALAFSGGTVYVGGRFSSISGQNRNRLAALDGVSGAALAWNPNVNSTVRTLVIANGTIYVGGTFTSIASQTRNHLAAFDFASGALTSWNPDSSGPIYTLLVSGGLVYAGGSYGIIGGQQRKCLAALDASSGMATTWNAQFYPQPDDGVFSLILSGGIIYAGGTFNNIGGQTRKNLAAIDTVSGALMDWNPSVIPPVDCKAQVNTMAISGMTLYVGGFFASINGQPRSNLAAVDIASGTVADWDPRPYTAVRTLAITDDLVYAGGDFSMVGGITRKNLAAFDAKSGRATSWSPNPNQAVSAIAISSGTVYVGGVFTQIGGQTRNHIAALDATTGIVLAWNPNANQPVASLAISSGAIYAAGGFTTIGGQYRNYIAALDASSGLATSWNPNADGTVSSLAISGGIIYASGLFYNIGGQPRYTLAALDRTTGLATDWNPQPNDLVYTIILADKILYVGGDFTTIGGKARNRIAALDTISGAATAWNPNASSTVSSLAILGNMVYAGGLFTIIGGQPQNMIAAIDASTGMVRNWDLNPYSPTYGGVNALAVSGGSLYAGGEFTIIGGQLQYYFAQFDTISTPVDPTATIAAALQADSLSWNWNDASDDENGFKVWADPGSGEPSTLRITTAAGATSWTMTGLTPNTQYAFQVAASNSWGDSYRTDVCSTFTLAAVPMVGQNVKPALNVGASRPLGTGLTFSNPAGFGAGTHGGGAFAVSGYRWAWDENVTYAFNGGEGIWNAGELSQTPTRAGRYYLHLQSVNAAGVATPQTLDVGPFILTMSNGVRKWGSYR